jgi:hypothetical protein
MNSYIAFDDSYSAVWDILFHDTTMLSKCTESGMKFIILGSDLEDFLKEHQEPGTSHVPTRPAGSVSYLALAVLNENRLRFTEAGWGSFRASLQPHQYDAGNYEASFDNVAAKLNVHQLLYNTLHREVIVTEPDRLFWEYYKSGFILTLSTCASMYEGHIGGGYIRQDSNQHYEIEIDISGRRRMWCIRKLWG